MIRMKEKLQAFIENAGWPRIIIGLFLLSLFIAAPFVGVRIDASLSDTLVRVGMNGVLVLAMVPMVQSSIFVMTFTRSIICPKMIAFVSPFIQMHEERYLKDYCC